MTRPRFLPDNFTLTLIATVILASLLPASGQTAVAFGWVTNLAIALLFFLHGAKLSRDAIVAGAGHWRLHLLVFSLTFVLFPLLGLALKPLLSPLIGNDLYMGMLYLCALPATVQSAIAFTSLARGNIPAAICSAAASSLFGIFLTPLLVTLLLNVHGDGGSTVDAILKISVQLLLPFVAGQIARRWIGDWVGRNKAWLKFVDQGSILLVVYGAFSEAVNEGIWHQIPLWELGGLVVACCVLLALVLVASALLGKAFGFTPGRPHHHPVLRFEEKPGHRRAHGPGTVRRGDHGRADPAADAVPSDPVDGVCGIGPALCETAGKHS
ncbi:sodium/bile acid cotransporter 7 [Pseudomonas sp. W4I3]|nr:sodium/bile acid cotransporter 7 [Pseudomonas sp. W4I3]